jgi:hypothetical protein
LESVLKLAEMLGLRRKQPEINFAVETTGSALAAMFASSALVTLSIVAAVAFLSWMRRATA